MARKRITITLTPPQRDEVILALRNQLEWDDLQPSRGNVISRILDQIYAAVREGLTK